MTTTIHKPTRRIVLMGCRKSGKTGIYSNVFRNVTAPDVLFNNPISTELSLNSFLDLSLWDYPGTPDLYSDTTDPAVLFANCICVVFVIDSKDDYYPALKQLFATVSSAYRVNKNMLFEVFVHKMDGLSDDHKIGSEIAFSIILSVACLKPIPAPNISNAQTETQRDIHTRIHDELMDAGLQDVHLGFHLTSIYDHSVCEAFSKVVQRVLGDEGILPTLENLLNILCSNSGIEKAFLFDTVTKIYIATDSSPVDVQSYELCSDMIDVVTDTGLVYGVDSRKEDALDKKESMNLEDGIKSVIRLNNGMVLYMRGINRTLALVSLLREENFEKHGLIDFNFSVFHEAVSEVFKIRSVNKNIRL
ncbi:hypothetical protein CcCBS67573_g03248 [Chytriomyces confervae]|uniref:GTP-binding protein n=1 Tax=Chytriomyces confervae TaxID=246404 RepID=A0A507FJC7_9FUNG|nr:hypothetical protein CcCBS67573_g03248 [Chytriomyces confervae]